MKQGNVEGCPRQPAREGCKGGLTPGKGPTRHRTPVERSNLRALAGPCGFYNVLYQQCCLAWRRTIASCRDQQRNSLMARQCHNCSGLRGVWGCRWVLHCPCEQHKTTLSEDSPLPCRSSKGKRVGGAACAALTQPAKVASWDCRTLLRHTHTHPHLAEVAPATDFMPHQAVRDLESLECFRISMLTKKASAGHQKTIIAKDAFSSKS